MMGFSVGFHVGGSKPCSRPGCEAGGTILAGQLQITSQDGDNQHSRHLDCLSRDQKRNIRKRHKNPAEIAGFKNLKPGDKDRVRECIGWNEETAATSGNRNNNNRSGEKTESKVNSKAKDSEIGVPGNAPTSSRQHAETRPMSPAQSESWYSNLPSWDDSVNPQAHQKNTRPNRGKEKEETNKQERRGNVQSERNVEPVPPLAGTSHQANDFRRPTQEGNFDSTNANPSNSNETKQEADYPVANSGPPAPPKPEIDQAVLMRLELEDKEAEARLAEAELALAETRVKVEAARRAVIAQKLMMAKAGVSPTI